MIMSKDVAVDLFNALVVMVDEGVYTGHMQATDGCKEKHQKLLSKLAHGLQDAQIDDLPDELTATSSFTGYIEYLHNLGILLEDAQWDEKYTSLEGWLNTYKLTVKLWKESPEAYQVMLEAQRDGKMRDDISKDSIKKLSKFMKDLDIMNEKTVRQRSNV